jgi:hypothetical protein
MKEKLKKSFNLLLMNIYLPNFLKYPKSRFVLNNSVVMVTNKNNFRQKGIVCINYHITNIRRILFFYIKTHKSKGFTARHWLAYKSVVGTASACNNTVAILHLYLEYDFTEYVSIYMIDRWWTNLNLGYFRKLRDKFSSVKD